MGSYPNAYAIGELIYFRHPTEEDARGTWHSWLSDPTTTRYLIAQNWPNSVEQQVEFVRSLKPYGSRMALAIVVKDEQSHIGIAGLSSIDYINRTAHVSVLIGEAEYRKGPYALEAYQLLLDVAFLRLNMRMVISAAVADNSAVRSIHERCGFREKGRIENMFWADGSYCDNVISVVGKEDWIRGNSAKQDD